MRRINDDPAAEGLVGAVLSPRGNSHDLVALHDHAGRNRAVEHLHIGLPSQHGAEDLCSYMRLPTAAMIGEVGLLRSAVKKRRCMELHLKDRVGRCLRAIVLLHVQAKLVEDTRERFVRKCVDIRDAIREHAAENGRILDQCHVRTIRPAASAAPNPPELPLTTTTS